VAVDQFAHQARRGLVPRYGGVRRSPPGPVACWPAGAVASAVYRLRGCAVVMPVRVSAWVVDDDSAAATAPPARGTRWAVWAC